jgi:hypothetical protein
MNGSHTFSLAAQPARREAVAAAAPTVSSALRAPLLPTRAASRQLELPFVTPPAAFRLCVRTG